MSSKSPQPEASTTTTTTTAAKDMSSKRQHRPPSLDVTAAKAGGGGGGANTGPNSSTSLEIANDIAIQCVSPGIPNFLSSEQTRDAVVISRNIEAQQRKLIAERMNGGQTPREGKPPGNITQQTVTVSPDSATAQLPKSSSLKSTTRRRGPPANLKLSSSHSFHNSNRPLINSAPLDRVMGSPPKTAGNNNNVKNNNNSNVKAWLRSASNPIRRTNKAGNTNNGDETRDNTTTTTIFLRHKALEDRGARTSLPNDGNKSPWLLTSPQPESSTGKRKFDTKQSEQPAQPKKKDNGNDNDDDPEDAALSDNERDDPEDCAIGEDELENHKKKRKLESPPPPARASPARALNASVCITPPSPNDYRRQANNVQISKDEKKRRFMQLAEQMWDLLQE